MIKRYSSPVNRFRTIRSCIALLALAIFAVPASGAHLHLCLDRAGSEPPASLHVSDDGTHHSEDANRAHRDVDRSLESEAVAKRVKSSPDVSASLPATQVLYVRRVAVLVEFSRDPRSLIVPVPAYRILPPLRAPPV